jgi:hypothetical protein
MTAVTPSPPTPPPAAKVPFFGRYKKLQIGLAVVTAGFWLLAPLTVWLWRTGRRRGAYVSGAVFSLGVLLIAIGSATGGKSSPKTTTTSANAPVTTPTTAPSAPAAITASTRAADDARAKAAIARVLKIVASNYLDFGDYTLVSRYAVGNLDHSLREVPGLKAIGQGKTFTVSVKSASGTTFTIRGNHLALTRTCSPVGAGCASGHWPGAKTLALPKVPVITAADKEKIRAILTASVSHYQHLLTLGQQALSGVQYANSTAGLNAFSDPNSAASRFSAYRKNPNPESDLSFLTAFKKADNFYTAANEPAAIGTWRDDMGTATSDLNEWVNLAVGWQIREKTTEQLRAAADKVTRDLAKAQADVTAVVAGT